MAHATASANHPIYQYGQLPSARSIRLLELISHVPATRSFEAKLHVFSLDAADLPAYSALSYAWQTPDIKGSELIERPDSLCIIVERQEILISETLFDLFDHNWKDDDNGDQLLWVDAVCINQENTSERNSQVEMMRDIYEGAQQVVVWLGLHDIDSRIAIPIIESIAGANVDVKSRQQPVPMSIRPFTSAHDYEAVGLPFVSADEWNAVTSFFTRAWFHRVWTIQEVRLARDTVMVCGDTSVDWDDICLFIVTTFVTGIATKLYLERQDALTNVNTVFGSDDTALMKGVFNAQNEANVKLDGIPAYLSHIFRYVDDDGFVASKLAWLLHLSRRRASSDARDRIYALKSLAVKYHEPHDWRRLRPDYLKSMETVFTETTRYIMEKIGNLSFLSFVEDRSGQQKLTLPSWVPDLNQRGTPLPLILFGEFNCFHGSQVDINLAKTFSLGVQESVSLRAMGTVLACLQAVSLPCDVAVRSSHLSSLLEFTLALRDIPREDESRGEALMKTLAAGIGYDPAPFGSRVGNGSFVALHQAFKQFLMLQISCEIHNWLVGTTRLYSTWWSEQEQLEAFCNSEANLPSRPEFDDYFAALSSLRADTPLSRSLPIIDDPDMFEQFFQPQAAYDDII